MKSLTLKTIIALSIGISMIVSLIVGVTYAYFTGGSFNISNYTGVNTTLADNNNLFSLVTIGNNLNFSINSEDMLQLKANEDTAVKSDNTSIEIRLNNPDDTRSLTCEYEIYYEYIIDDSTTNYTRTNIDKKEFTYEITKESTTLVEETNFVNTTSGPQKVGGKYYISSYGSEIIDTININTRFYNLNNDQSVDMGSNWKLKFYVVADGSKCEFSRGPGLYTSSGTLVESYDNLVKKYGFDPTTDEGYNYFWDYEWVYNDAGGHSFDIADEEMPSSIPYVPLLKDEYQNATMLILPDGLEKIGKSAFGYTNIKEIYVPDTVTEIGNYAFSNVKAVHYNGTAVDENNSNWGASVINPYIDDGYVYDSESKNTLYAYIGSSKNIIIPNTVNNIAENVLKTSSGYIWVKCHAGYYDCIEDGYNVSFEEGSSITTIGNGTFENSTIESIVIPNSVTTIGRSAFAYCKNLKSFTFENNSILQSIGDYAFEFAFDNLNSIVIPKTVVNIGNDAFWAAKVNNVSFENSSQLQTIGDSVFNNKYINYLSIPSSVTSIGNRAFEGVKVLSYNGSLTSSDNWNARSLNPYVENDFVYSNSSKTTLLTYAGSNKNIIIPSTVTTIGASAFYESDIKSVTIPSSVVTINNKAFDDCKELESVVFQSGSNLTTIGNDAFDSDYNLSSFSIPSSVTKIGSYALSAGLVELNVPSTVNNIGTGAFSGDIVVRYSGTATSTNNWRAKTLNPAVVENGFIYSDSNKTNLIYYYGDSTDITIPRTVTTIGKEAFASSKLTSVLITNNVTSIEEGAFKYSYSLKNVTFESGSQLTTIGSEAFYSCSNILQLNIPSTVTSIGSSAFYRNKVVNYTGTATDPSGNNWSASTFNPYTYNYGVYNDNSKTELLMYYGDSETFTIPASVTSFNASAFADIDFKYIIFENPYGWRVKYHDAYMAKSSTLLSNAETAANMIRVRTYNDVTWERIS